MGGLRGQSPGVTDVHGTWMVPTAKSCSSANGFSAFWVGIEGYGTSTVEQTGTPVDCSAVSALYSAWYEFYPAAPVTLGWVVHPGDTMVGEVKARGSTFTVM